MMMSPSFRLISSPNVPKRPKSDYSASFLAAFLAAAFFAGFSSASIEAFSSARAERSPRVVFSTFGISTCGSSGLAAFLAALAGASLRSSPVRARTEDTLSVTTSLNHLERQFVANSTPAR